MNAVGHGCGCVVVCETYDVVTLVKVGGSIELYITRSTMYKTVTKNKEVSCRIE
jgi:hypothetical protein